MWVVSLLHCADDDFFVILSSNGNDGTQMKVISATLIDWYEQYGRDLPWRRTSDPYRIWLSEVILQQTRIAQGEAYYLRFIKRFPNVAQLAEATEDEVLKLWQGLGYYSRARNLHAAAQQIVKQHGGLFPRTFAEVRALKGVGDYTAAAICSFAYQLPTAVVDGNVYRVLARLFDIELAIDSGEGRKAFASLADELLDRNRPALHNQAIMDFGALCCTPASPHCKECPLQERCLAYVAGNVAKRPVKCGKTHLCDRHLNYLHLTCDGDVILLRRPAGDIWQGLYDLPAIETTEAVDFSELSQHEIFRQVVGDIPYQLVSSITMPKHQLSHQRLYARFYHIALHRWPTQLPATWQRIPATCVKQYAVSRLTERYFASIK
jgi:A/G-specific adenine glycosylase